MNKLKITDVYFDLDHTLWDFEANSKSAFEKTLKKHKIPVCINDFLKIYEPINHRFWEDYSKGLKTKEEVKYNRLKLTFKHLQIPITTNRIKILADEYLNFLKKERNLIEGTVEILNYLKDNRYNLHILTNGFKEIQIEKMKNSGISHFFKHCISSEEAGNLKPHPSVFKYALKRAKTFPHQSVMIGDNLKSDILGARNVGMHVIHYDPLCQNNIDFKIIPKVKVLLEIRDIL